ncbi:MAG: general secretion pathway protein GspK [Phycisphaerales bacterium]|nr:MAG: general secretion pathway protein GspK [Phycisphaerales bacterium]
MMTRKSCKTGLVLVAVLWLVVLLTVMSAAVGRNSRLDTKVSVLRTEHLRCKWAGRAGVETAIGLLNDDVKALDSLDELWSDNDEDYNDVPLEGCRFTVKVIDEASKLNVNTVTREQLLGLWDMAEETADAIIDWRDSNDELSGSGVEGGYYENMPYAYMIRNGPFRTIRELLMVRGVTEELLYGEDTNLNGELDYNERDGDESPPDDDADDELDLGWIAYLTCYSYDLNTDADEESRVNINTADEGTLQNSLGISRAQARWIVENRSYDSIGDLISNNSPAEASSSGGGSDNAQQMDLATFYTIADRITVDSGNQTEGKVNINTASALVLSALLGADDEADRVASEIVAYRETSLTGMQSIADILQAGVVSLEQFKEIANSITTRSNVFTVRCFATAERGVRDGAEYYTEAVVDRSPSPAKILYWYQGANY